MTERTTAVVMCTLMLASGCSSAQDDGSGQDHLFGGRLAECTVGFPAQCWGALSCLSLDGEGTFGSAGRCVSQLTVSGRLVDQQGQPLRVADLSVSFEATPENPFNDVAYFTTTAEGTFGDSFQLYGLPYFVKVQRSLAPQGGAPFEDLPWVDLSDVNVGGWKRIDLGSIWLSSLVLPIAYMPPAPPAPDCEGGGEGC